MIVAGRLGREPAHAAVHRPRGARPTARLAAGGEVVPTRPCIHVVFSTVPVQNLPSTLCETGTVDFIRDCAYEMNKGGCGNDSAAHGWARPRCPYM